MSRLRVDRLTYKVNPSNATVEPLPTGLIALAFREPVFEGRLALEVIVPDAGEQPVLADAVGKYMMLTRSTWAWQLPQHRYCIAPTWALTTQGALQ